MRKALGLGRMRHRLRWTCKINRPGGCKNMEPFVKNNYKVREKEMMSLSVYNVGYQRCSPMYQWGPGVRDHYLIHTVISGKGVYETGGQRYELGPGDIFLAYPHTTISYCADRTEPWMYYWVGFNGSDAAYILDCAGFSPQNPVMRAAPFAKELRDALLQIYDARGNTLAHSVKMTGRLYGALSLFLENGVQPAAETDVLASYTRQAVEYINYRYSYPITVDDIAAYVGISRSHLYRAFRAVLGQSPKTYLSKFRIKQACLLLERQELSVASIAQSVGYESGLYFSKVFHRIKGTTPTEYARQAAEKARAAEPENQ